MEYLFVFYSLLFEGQVGFGEENGTGFNIVARAFPEVGIRRTKTEPARGSGLVAARYRKLTIQHSIFKSLN
ncbi:unnamed protein product [Parnassius apollo]|uniref:(apollo) hypothetical protein n=1 Tax=Parnassius apollo TaxID=110799 RepID=A0A8S3XIM9_PARAO|nr:unnamed protein product [Parnassius apollo]